jgi:hypothetical protein
MLHQNEYTVLYQDSDGSSKEAPSSGNRLKEKICFTDSISQHIAEIEDESLEVYLVVLHSQSVIQETRHKRMSLAKSRLDSRRDGHITKDQTKK